MRLLQALHERTDIFSCIFSRRSTGKQDLFSQVRFTGCGCGAGCRRDRICSGEEIICRLEDGISILVIVPLPIVIGIYITVIVVVSLGNSLLIFNLITPKFGNVDYGTLKTETI